MIFVSAGSLIPKAVSVIQCCAIDFVKNPSASVSFSSYLGGEVKRTEKNTRFPAQSLSLQAEINQA